MRISASAVILLWAASASAFAPCPTLPRLSPRGSASSHLRTSASTSAADLDEEAAPSSSSRRGLIAAASAAILLGPRAAGAITYGSGDFSGASAVNGVLSAYGLPQFPDTPGIKPFLRQYGQTVVEFSHPTSWVINDRAKMQGKVLKTGDTGVTVSDYRTAEGLLWPLSSPSLATHPCASHLSSPMVCCLPSKHAVDGTHVILPGGILPFSNPSRPPFRNSPSIKLSPHANENVRWGHDP